jgi:hypothetical protein
MAEDIMQMALLAKALGGSGSKSNLTTLFGLDPDIVTQQQAQQQLQGSRNEAMQYAQMDPYQRANYMLYQGGSGISGGLMNAIGPDNAQVARAKKLQEFTQIMGASGFNINTVEGQQAGAQLASKMGLQDVAVELNNNALNMAKTQAETTKALQPGTEVERSGLFLTNLDKAIREGKQVAPEALAQAGFTVQQLTQPTLQMGPDGRVITVTPPNPLTNFPDLNKALQKTAPQQAPTQGMSQQQVPTGMQGGETTQLAPGMSVTKFPEKVDASVRKDIATTDKLITDADSTVSKLMAIGPKLKALDVSLPRNIGRGMEAQLGVSGKDQLVIDDFKSLVEKTRNDILNQANGVQAKDDAERVINEVFGDPTIWRSPARLQAAYERLTTLVAGNAEALRTKRGTLVPEGANVGQAPKAPQQASKPKTSRADAFAAMKASNPSASDAKINKWLDTQGY